MISEKVPCGGGETSVSPAPHRGPARPGPAEPPGTRPGTLPAATRFPLSLLQTADPPHPAFAFLFLNNVYYPKCFWAGCAFSSLFFFFAFLPLFFFFKGSSGNKSKGESSLFTLQINSALRLAFPCRPPAPPSQSGLKRNLTGHVKLKGNLMGLSNLSVSLMLKEFIPRTGVMMLPKVQEPGETTA